MINNRQSVFTGIGWIATLVLSIVSTNARAADDTVKVFILAGQSNMVGQAKNTLWEYQATDAKTKDFFAHFRKGDKWIERDDAFITFFDCHGKLMLGYDHTRTTGSALEFGWVLADHFNEPVLLIKAAWGGHSLYKRFRSPSAGMPPAEHLEEELGNAKKSNANETMEQIKSEYGSSYRDMMKEIKRVHDNYQTLFPQLEGKKFDLAGFFWFQGFNDQFGPYAPEEYASNMKHFIKDVRKDLEGPNLPFVIAGIGTFGWNGTSKPNEGSAVWKVLNGQLTMNTVPEFEGSIKAFETAPLYDKEAAKIYPSWAKNFDEWKKVGSDRPYHYLGSAIWYTRIGHEAAEAMVELIEGR